MRIFISLIVAKYYERDRGSALEMPKHRFLRITNGTVNTDDIPTNYEFTGEKSSPLNRSKPGSGKDGKRRRPRLKEATEMRNLLSLITACLGLCMTGQAMACSPTPPPYDIETGMPLYQHWGPEKIRPFDFDFTSEDAIIAVVRAKTRAPFTATIEPNGYPVTYQAQSSKLKTVEKIRGKLSKTQDFVLPVRDESWPVYDKTSAFDFWEDMNLPKSLGVTKHFGSDCSPAIIEPSVKDGKYYIAYGEGKSLTKDNITLLSIAGPEDPLVEAIKLMAFNSEMSPRKYSAENYMRALAGFSQIQISNCPAEIEFRFYDSPLVNPDNQRGKIYTLMDSFHPQQKNDQNFAVNYLDIKSYQSQFSATQEFHCQVGDQYLVLHSRFPKLLKIDQGSVMKRQIKTNIEISGPEIISVEQVKAWIKAGYEPPKAYEK